MSETLSSPKPAASLEKPIWFFEEGSGRMKDLLGGKGAGLAEMTRAGLPVPAGFTITTQACLEYYRLGRRTPPDLARDLRPAMTELERRTGKRFGEPVNPLLVSVRSGARVSMPGMMDTILNLGLNDATVTGLAQLTGNDRFAWDAYRRFICMFAGVVLGVEKQLFEERIEAAKRQMGVDADPQIDAPTWQRLAGEFKSIVAERAGRPFPQNVYEQLDLAIGAVFDSWNSKRAIDYRRYNKISDDWGTAVSVVSMVFGNMGEDSGTGVAFTRDPNTGERSFSASIFATRRAKMSWPAFARLKKSSICSARSRKCTNSSARSRRSSNVTIAKCRISSLR